MFRILISQQILSTQHMLKNEPDQVYGIVFERNAVQCFVFPSRPLPKSRAEERLESSLGAFSFHE
jgi:hypothetical protein